MKKLTLLLLLMPLTGLAQDQVIFNKGDTLHATIVQRDYPFVYFTLRGDSTKRRYQVHMDAIKRIRMGVDHDTVAQTLTPSFYAPGIAKRIDETGIWVEKTGKRLLRATILGVLSSATITFSALNTSATTKGRQTGVFLGSALGVVALGELMAAEAAVIQVGRNMKTDKGSSLRINPLGLGWCYRF